MSNVVGTGAITGTLTMADGTVYDVTPFWVENVADEHVAELSHRVSMHYVEHGHPTDPDFIYDNPEKDI